MSQMCRSLSRAAPRLDHSHLCSRAGSAACCGWRKRPRSRSWTRRTGSSGWTAGWCPHCAGGRDKTAALGTVNRTWTLNCNKKLYLYKCLRLGSSSVLKKYLQNIQQSPSEPWTSAARRRFRKRAWKCLTWGSSRDCRPRSWWHPSPRRSATAGCLCWCWAAGGKQAQLSWREEPQGHCHSGSPNPNSWLLTMEVDIEMWKNFPLPPWGIALVKKNLCPSWEKSGGSFCRAREQNDFVNVQKKKKSTRSNSALFFYWSTLTTSKRCLETDVPVYATSSHSHPRVSRKDKTVCECDKRSQAQSQSKIVVLFSQLWMKLTAATIVRHDKDISK